MLKPPKSMVTRLEMDKTNLSQSSLLFRQSVVQIQSETCHFLHLEISLGRFSDSLQYCNVKLVLSLLKDLAFFKEVCA